MSSSLISKTLTKTSVWISHREVTWPGFLPSLWNVCSATRTGCSSHLLPDRTQSCSQKPQGSSTAGGRECSREAVSGYTYSPPPREWLCNAGTGRRTFPACTQGWFLLHAASSEPCCRLNGKHCSEGRLSPGRSEHVTTLGYSNKLTPIVFTW